MRAPSRFLALLGWVALATSCRKATPLPQTTPPAPTLYVSTVLPDAASSAFPARAASAQPSTVELPQAGKPMPLNEAGLRVAKTYFAELSQGRKATVAKNYAQAADHFSKCLEALPQDARALAERGYARLLAGKLAEADADLEAATRGAPSSAVLAQIVHNRMLAARQRGDEDAARAIAAQKKQLEAARRLPTGVTCSSDVVDSDLEPQVSKSLDEALTQLLAAHATEDGMERSDLAFDAGPRADSNVANELRSRAARGPLPDGAWQLWSSGKSSRNHVLIARAGRLYGFPNQSSGYLALCGLDEAADVTVSGGGARPLTIQRHYRQLVRGYSPDDGSGQTMGFCAWVSSRVDVIILNAKTLRGLRILSASAHPTDENRPAQEPEHLVELEWQAEHVVVEACGARTVVPYARERPRD